MPDIQEGDLIEEGALPPDDFHDNIERIREVAAYDLEVPADIIERVEEESRHLLVDREVLLASAASLAAGHLVLQGPPGTGKSSLARALCRAFHCSFLPVTAHEDWSTFEVIGRQELRVDDQGQEQIVPVNGFFTEAVIRTAGAMVRHFDNPDEPQATWLLIDELNRAHVDKAFGELFTVLGTDEVIAITLPHQRDGNRELATPRRFRLIATLNTVDRQFVNSLGQGLKRRFTFVTVDIPPRRPTGESWGEGESLAGREFNMVADRAAARVAERVTSIDNGELEQKRMELVELLNGPGRSGLESLFSLVESVRYAAKDTGVPYLPVGTAQLIDVVELFLTRIHMESVSSEGYPRAMDWATSVKLAPLFDVETISPSELEAFANELPPPYDGLTQREFLQIVAAGQYFVEP